jgi:hypothetical protein
MAQLDMSKNPSRKTGPPKTKEDQLNIYFKNLLKSQTELNKSISNSLEKMQKSTDFSIKTSNDLIKKIINKEETSKTTTSKNPWLGLLLLGELVLIGICIFIFLIKIQPSVSWAGYITMAAIIGLCALLLVLADFNTNDQEFKNNVKKLEVVLVIAALCISIIGVAQNQLTLEETKSTSKETHDALILSQEMFDLAIDESNRVAKISFVYPWDPILPDTNWSAGFWVENTGYRTILLQPDCLLTMICDNNFKNNLARAEVVRIATGRTLEDYNSINTIILKIGDLVFFRSPNTVDNRFSIDSNKLKGTNCYVSCPIKDMTGTLISDANIQIRRVE